MTPAVATIAATVAAKNRFGNDADLAAPEVAAFVSRHAEGFAAAAHRMSAQCHEVFAEPAAWSHRDLVLALVDTGTPAASIVSALRTMRGSFP